MILQWLWPLTWHCNHLLHYCLHCHTVLPPEGVFRCPNPPLPFPYLCRKNLRMEPVKDILYPSDNLYDIPCLRLDRQAGHLELPFVPYGTGRRNKRVATLHFYVDDYRFNALWKNPAKIFDNNPAAAVECNYSLFDTTPLAFGLQFIYQKRWMATTGSRTASASMWI